MRHNFIGESCRSQTAIVVTHDFYTFVLIVLRMLFIACKVIWKNLMDVYNTLYQRAYSRILAICSNFITLSAIAAT
jgi:hypothetical protein